MLRFHNYTKTELHFNIVDHIVPLNFGRTLFVELDII